VTDATRNFTDQEWQRLRGHYDFINQRRERANGRGRGGGRNSACGGPARGRGRINDDISARSIQALQQASSILSEIMANTNTANNIQGGNNVNAGNNFGVASYGGRHVRFENQGGRGPRTMSKIITQPRRSINSARSHSTATPASIVANCEVDSHADTCCLGANFVPVYFMGKVCDVSPFLDSMPTQNDVEICTGATAFEDDTGNTVILIVNEALWMGDRMQHSLINPYQIRAAGIQRCDDPTDDNRPFGIQVDEFQIPFKMAGSTCIFPTRTPTQWELDNCPHVEITSDLEWNPNGVHFGHDVSVDDSGESVTISAYDTRHRRPDIDPATLSKQWGIGLETARNTIRATTQLGIRHALHPITRRYRTDYMSLRHRRLHTTFYSDTLFTKTRSLHGHKCAQVTTDGWFLHTYPMFSKSHAGDALTHFVSDVGIPDVVVVDNAPELTGTNTEFQRVCRYYKITQHQTEPFTPRQNRAELGIRELKKRWRNKM